MRIKLRATIATMLDPGAELQRAMYLALLEIAKTCAEAQASHVIGKVVVYERALQRIRDILEEFCPQSE